MFYQNWKLSIIALIMIPLAAIIAKKLSHFHKNSHRNSHKRKHTREEGNLDTPSLWKTFQILFNVKYNFIINSNIYNENNSS